MKASRASNRKSFTVGKILDTLTSKKHGKPERDIVIISGVEEDEALDKERGPKGDKRLPERIDIYDPEFNEMTDKDFEDCIVVMDDIVLLAKSPADMQRMITYRTTLLYGLENLNLNIGETDRVNTFEKITQICAFSSHSDHLLDALKINSIEEKINVIKMSFIGRLLNNNCTREFTKVIIKLYSGVPH